MRRARRSAPHSGRSLEYDFSVSCRLSDRIAGALGTSSVDAAVEVDAALAATATAPVVLRKSRRSMHPSATRQRLRPWRHQTGSRVSRQWRWRVCQVRAPTALAAPQVCANRGIGTPTEQFDMLSRWALE